MARAHSIGIGLEHAIAGGQVSPDFFRVQRTRGLDAIAQVRSALSQQGGEFLASSSEKEQPPPDIFLEYRWQSRAKEGSHMARVGAEMPEDNFVLLGDSMADGSDFFLGHTCRHVTRNRQPDDAAPEASWQQFLPSGNGDKDSFGSPRDQFRHDSIDHRQHMVGQGLPGRKWKGNFVKHDPYWFRPPAQPPAKRHVHALGPKSMRHILHEQSKRLWQLVQRMFQNFQIAGTELAWKSVHQGKIRNSKSEIQ